MMRSDCLGLGRNIPAPKRSISNRDAPVAIISIAQHARPNVMGQSADFRAQLNRESTVVVMMFFSNRSSIQAGMVSKNLQFLRRRLRPVQGAFLDNPNISDDQDAEKHEHFHQPEKRELPIDDGPREQEYRLDIEDHEKNGNDVVTDGI